MSTNTTFATLLSALLLFSAVQEASAYYDPGVQRWLNRDPLWDLGMPAIVMRTRGQSFRMGVSSSSCAKLTTYVSNNPITVFDPLGLYDFSDDDDYVEEAGQYYNARCLKNAADNGIKCAKAAGLSGFSNLGICILGCLPTLLIPPHVVPYATCVAACGGVDALTTLYELAACLDEYNKAKAACKVCDLKR